MKTVFAKLTLSPVGSHVGPVCKSAQSYALRQCNSIGALHSMRTGAAPRGQRGKRTSQARIFETMNEIFEEGGGGNVRIQR